MSKLLPRLKLPVPAEGWSLVALALVMLPLPAGLYFFLRARSLDAKLPAVQEGTRQALVLLRDGFEAVAYAALGTSLLMAAGVWVVGFVIRAARRNEQHAREALAESESRLLEAERVARIGYWRWDAVADSIFLSPQAAALLGRLAGDQHVSLAEMTGVHAFDDERRLLERIDWVMATGKSSEVDVRIPTLCGDRWAHSIIRPSRDAQGDIVGVFGTLQDITARKRIEEELSALKADYCTLLDHLPAIVLYMDADGRCLMVNEAAAQFSGIPKEHYVGKHFTEINPIGADRRLADNLEVIATGNPKRCQIEQITLPNGRRRWVQADKIPRRDAAGRVIGVVVFAIDVTDRKRAEERIAHLAACDPLTDLCNRRVLSDRLDQALAACRRRAQRCALIFVDLDEFKNVNDTHGHEVGDAVLVEVAQRLRQSVRAEDTVARLGGDEFVILLPLIGSVADAVTVARKVSARLAEPIEAANGVVSIGSSIGIAVYPEHGATEQELMRAADRAMYGSKSNGRGLVKIAEVSEKAAV